MWILTGIVLGSLITSTHDSEEACRGRMAMLNKVKEVKSLDCKSVQITTYNTTGSISTLCMMTVNGKCAQ